MRCQIMTRWTTGDTNRPTLSTDHPLPSGASWMDVTGQQAYQIPTLPNAYVVECWSVMQDWINAVDADSDYVVLWSGADDAEPTGSLTSQQLTAIRTYFSTAETAELDHYVGTATNGRTVTEIAEQVRDWGSKFLRQDSMAPADYVRLVNRYPAYQVGKLYAAGELFAYADNLYRVVQPHTSQADWLPSTTPALYTHAVPRTVIPAWVQPTGAQDAYALDALVTHNGQVWQSQYAANVWEPGVFGWVVVE